MTDLGGIKTLPAQAVPQLCERFCQPSEHFLSLVTSEHCIHHSSSGGKKRSRRTRELSRSQEGKNGHTVPFVCGNYYGARHRSATVALSGCSRGSHAEHVRDTHFLPRRIIPGVKAYFLPRRIIPGVKAYFRPRRIIPGVKAYFLPRRIIPGVKAYFLPRRIIPGVKAYFLPRRIIPE
ncbi:hypothetical protein BaRGS_00032711 [Batillaria attramentaria]|uniref:Uncharacterized protein n=1 Tax=Batillaria attramentaria TaxID=370345 RepID=A0ABD0JML5_9CAEN